MARLTTFSRLLITMAIVAGVFFAVKTFLPGLTKNIGANPDTEQVADNASNAPSDKAAPQEAEESSSKSSSWGKSSSYTPTPFSYVPPTPNGGKLKAVVELGATGFNSFIVRIDAAKNWKLEKAEFGASLVKEGLATDEDVKSGLKRYIADILGFGVGPRDIHFVISSGAKKVDVTDKIIGELKRMNYVVNTVTPEQEAKLALRAAMPKDYQSSGFVVDVGSGNTKIAWYTGNAPTGVEGLGSKYFQDGSTTDEAAFSDTKSKATRVPAAQRGTCFVIGGVPYELAKQHRKEQERYTLLKAFDAYEPKGDKQKAGLNILNGIAAATGCKQFVFDWDANFTIGFLLGL